ncbi:MAG: Tfp pilus assembly protein FimT/FimU [Microgenomates group bacterium]
MKNSFTLIELLLVITIISLGIGTGLAMYNSFTEEKKLEMETQKLVDVLELAKKKASSGDIGSYDCSNFSGYRVNIQSLSYQLLLCCSQSCTPNYLIQNYNFQTNISAIIGTGFIQFKPLTAALTSPVTIQIKNLTINKCRQINISVSGVIESITNSIGC